MYGFSRVKNRRVIRVKKEILFTIVALAILLLQPCLQTFFTTSTMLWKCLLKKLRLYLNEKYVFKNKSAKGSCVIPKITLDSKLIYNLVFSSIYLCTQTV